MRPGRTLLYADPAGLFLHDIVLDACRRHAPRTALVDLSTSGGPRRLKYRAYAEAVEGLARGMLAAGLRPGEVVALLLPNSWEFCVAYHAATRAGAVPTPMNPHYRSREVRHQLEDSGAAFLVSDGPQLRALEPGALPAALRRVFWTREGVPGAEPFAALVRPAAPGPPRPAAGPDETLAALPYSSGTTGLPKGVMLTHANLVTNVFQFLAPGEEATFRAGETILLFLPLYHIYGLNVVLTPALVAGGTLVLAPRFDLEATLGGIVRDEVTFLPVVPPVLAVLTQTAEAGRFPAGHRVRAVKSGAAPLAAGLPQRFMERIGIPVRQGYGMTEASPVTHLGFVEAGRCRPDTIGTPVARTECRVVDDAGRDLPDGDSGELLIRGPQVMRGYWRAPEATAEALRDGWYWSGDVARRESDGSFVVVDRRKEMIKYKGFAVAPAEVEAALLEHALVRDCGVIGRADPEAGEVPCAFVMLRDPGNAGPRVVDELRRHLAGRLAGYKQPRDLLFVPAIPRTPSGKILRRELRAWVG